MCGLCTVADAQRVLQIGFRVVGFRPMKRVIVLILLGLALLPAAGAQGATLLNPQGAPVGGVWQQWIDRSHMPTFSGPVVLDLDTQHGYPCGRPAKGVVDACSSDHAWTPVAPPLASDPETLATWDLVMNSGYIDMHFALLYEQAHIIDFRYLTDADRAELLQLWGQPPLPAGEPMSSYWWQGSGWAKVGPYTYGEWFSSDYAICAMFPNWSLRQEARTNTDTDNEIYPGSRAEFEGDRRDGLRDIQIQRESCVLIRDWINQAQTGSLTGDQ